MPTARLLIVALIAAPLLALAEVAPPLGVIALLYLALVGGLVLLDLRLIDGPAAFEIERQHDQRLSLGAANQVFITVRHRGQRDTVIQLRDEPPDAWLGGERGEVSGTSEVPLTSPTVFTAPLPAYSTQTF